jgi:small subunit ribosomal protein S9
MSDTRTYSTGRRKTAVARVWVTPGKGTFTINTREDLNYFARPTSRMVIRQPFEELDVLGDYDVVCTVKGGGTSAQAGAIRHGITRALLKINPDDRSKLKSAGYITRDDRKKERKKPGLKGARARFQFSKR